MTRRQTTRSLLILVLVFNVTFAGFCSSGLMASLRSALNAAPSLVNGLVASGALSQVQADGAVKDFTDGGTVALNLKSAFDAAGSDRAKKAQAAHKAANEWRAIVNRGHFRVHPKVEQAFSIADGIFLFVEAYYADQAGETPHAGSPAVDGLSESEFRDQLKQKVKDLERAMRGQ